MQLREKPQTMRVLKCFESDDMRVWFSLNTTRNQSGGCIGENPSEPVEQQKYG